MAVTDMLIQAGFATSKSHARRLVLDKAIRINDELITDPNTRIAVVKNEDGTFTMFKLEEKENG
jgi:ribosomal protein S4